MTPLVLALALANPPKPEPPANPAIDPAGHRRRSRRLTATGPPAG